MTEEDKLPLGIFYIDKGIVPFEERLPADKKSKNPMYEREVDSKELEKLIKSKE